MLLKDRQGSYVGCLCKEHITFLAKQRAWLTVVGCSKSCCLLLAATSLLKAQIPLTSSGEILCPESQFIASKLPGRPPGTAGHNAAVRGSSVICVVHWPQFIRFVDSDSRLSGLMGLSVQPFCARFPMDLVFRLYDESAHSLRTDANGNKDCCLPICQ